ncbi:MAG: radical SAM family heme chaperone HemW [Bacteroidales bacterium]|jgi:oxygen-independent coproporphyrinogen-3 oxidase|nr:radical SAM family heme chaperone HemW [Bacteroidales bacterium]
MAGLYVHIPFCKRRCIYCDFFSCVSKDVPDAYITKLGEELEERKTFLTDRVTTLYFGGGTPSLMSLNQIEYLISQINKYFPVSQMEEITLEANPDDLYLEYLKGLKSIGVNRLSIGVQSFDDKELQLLGRRHNAAQAIKAINDSADADFENVSIDLMFALPAERKTNSFEMSLKKAVSLPVNHISAYLLSQENDTALDTMIKKGLITLPDEEKALEEFDFTEDFLTSKGFIHYETSSYCLLGCYSKHNSNYWKQKQYLGIGAAAHSFNGEKRMWNVADLFSYVEKPLNETRKSERLTLINRYEEYIMLSLRTMEGLDVSVIEKEFPTFYSSFLQKSQIQIDAGLLKQENTHLKATRLGQHLLNQLILSLF